MRKLLPFLLLAGVAAPALAAGQPNDQDQISREERQEAREQARAQRAAERAARAAAEAPSPGAFARHNDGGGSDQPPVVMRGHEGGDNGARAMEVRRQRLGGFQQIESAGGGEPQIDRRDRDGDSSEPVRRLRRGEGPGIVRPQIVEQGPIDQAGDSDGRLRQSDRALPRIMRSRVPVVSQTPREGTQPPPSERLSERRRDRVQWSTHWRGDRRYDWRRWRDRHRSIFRLGFYYDPFGWNYRPYSIGWRLWPSYYSSRYWLHDPWQYRLPYAPPGYRWIRYWNDAVLVDTWDGRVVDVIYNFFW